MHKNRLHSEDYEYINSLSQAVLQKSPFNLRIVLYLWTLVVVVFLLWANLAKIDELVRADGEIVPGGDNQLIQNLEGGIIEEILVSEAQMVKKGDVLVKIDNRKSTSTYASSRLKSQELQAQIFRLKAEATGSDLEVDKKFRKKYPELYKREKKLYSINKSYIDSQSNILKQQKYQTESELRESRTRVKDLKRSLALIKEEIVINEPMVEKGIKSKIDFLKLQREENDIRERYNSARELIPRLKSSLREIEEKKSEIKQRFMSEAQEKLNELTSELLRIENKSDALQDQVKRTVVISPVNGHVQKLFVHTLGGVIKPGDDIVEIVPSDAALWVEVNVKPADIAFIYPSQEAMVKISAYDFAIFGALKGEVVSISADTIMDSKENRFYKVKIKTQVSQFSKERKIILMPGMTVNADIITGKKTVMDYILKPILKTKQYMFSER
ncbi:HlyD family type I secretion periplasmic adaptor subunit [Sulfurimonas aquatica]|uniref:HlyD family type I secretion periplasmic adaptor subunit n=1 Tax=Sulfurimonas aquatica TaxID=2672570 RepID=UPI001F623E44|nr:HlyD family type I secretion periplasmic adaptor subunit [Sulfurimonas aquatica]